MLQNDLVIQLNLEAHKETIIDLDKYMPLGKIECDGIEAIAYKDAKGWKKLTNLNSFDNKTARTIKVTASKDSQFSLYLGLGYIASKADDWTSLFTRKGRWAGSDGIFSFNLTNGNDSFGQLNAVDTLFVFGDTLIGKIDKNTNRRLYPILMPSNTIAYLKGTEPKEENIEFHFNTDEFDTVIPYYKPDNDAQYEGTLPHHLCKYTTDKQLTPWLSGYNPKRVELLFDLYDNYYINYIDFYNYHIEEHSIYGLEQRGIKEFDLVASNDQNEWFHLGKKQLNKAERNEDFNRIDVKNTYRYFKVSVPPLQGVGNHYNKDDLEEVVFGLNKVKFYSDHTLLTDVSVKATSIMKKSKLDTWFWLQDGVVIGNQLYFLPIAIAPDLSKPEGLQFEVKGTAFIKTPIVNGRLDFSKQTQKDTSLFVEKNGGQWLFGNAIMNHTEEAGAPNADGYIYIYGYSTINFVRSLHVARVLAKDFEHISKWEYYSENGWIKELTKAKPLLQNISCEMSVSPITSGQNKGKYLAVFQYDVNSSFVAYSIGETPYGPFTEAQIIYECPEPVTLGNTAYTYNAKAHPHLSTSKEVLVTYNTNAYSMEQNESNYDVYHPRFIKLHDTSVDE